MKRTAVGSNVCSNSGSQLIKRVRTSRITGPIQAPKEVRDTGENSVCLLTIQQLTLLRNSAEAKALAINFDIPNNLDDRKKRLALNRLAASRSRARNKYYTKNLEQHIGILEEELAVLRLARKRLVLGQLKPQAVLLKQAAQLGATMNFKTGIVPTPSASSFLMGKSKKGIAEVDVEAHDLCQRRISAHCEFQRQQLHILQIQQQYRQIQELQRQHAQVQLAAYQQQMNAAAFCRDAHSQLPWSVGGADQGLRQAAIESSKSSCARILPEMLVSHDMKLNESRSITQMSTPLPAHAAVALSKGQTPGGGASTWFLSKPTLKLDDAWFTEAMSENLALIAPRSSVLTAAKRLYFDNTQGEVSVPGAQVPITSAFDADVLQAAANKAQIQQSCVPLTIVATHT